MKNIDWDALADSIKEGQTILFLGQGITYNYQNPGNEALAFAQIRQELGEDALSFHQKDGLFILKTTPKRKLTPKLKEFYGKDFTNPLLEKLAEIPFHLIISLTPDVALKKVFQARQFPHAHAYYKLNQKDDLGKPEKEKPLLYNLFGCVEGGKDDLYIEHADLFDYVRSIYNPNSEPPDVIMSCFAKGKTDTIIFLGCGFDKWYFQLILHLLKIHDIETNTSVLNNTANDWQNVYEQKFKINFVEDNLEEFVHNLHQQFAPAELRKADASLAFSIEELKTKLNEWIEEGDYPKAFTAIEANPTLVYDKVIFNQLRDEMSFKITLNTIKQLQTFITSLKNKA